MDTTPDSVEVNACWAPITSLLSRETSAPVWVRVKNATGIRCTCSKTSDAQVVDQALADAGGEVALDQADARVDDREARDEQGQPGDDALSPVPTPSSMITAKSSGVATTSTASMTTSTRNPAI